MVSLAVNPDTRPNQSAAPASARSSRANAVDQNPIRRRGTGLRALDATRASAGLTLFVPLEGDGTVYLIDFHGNVAHTWKMPYPPGLYGYLTEKGTLFYNGKIPEETFQGKAPWKGGVALEADWNGKVLWEVRQQRVPAAALPKKKQPKNAGIKARATPKKG